MSETNLTNLSSAATENSTAELESSNDNVHVELILKLTEGFYKLTQKEKIREKVSTFLLCVRSYCPSV